MLNGFLSPSIGEALLWTLLFTHITIAAVTIFLHRCQAHRALDLHPAPSHFFRFWLWLTTGMTTKTWVAIHRKHHAKCETKEDPHSPVTRGLNKVLFDGVGLYKEEGRNQETLDKYGRGTPDDWLERRVYSRDRRGIAIMLIADLLLFGPIGLTVWAIQMIWIPFFAAGVINGIGHYWGYRSFQIKDASTNIVPWGILVGGEELHNNHHTFPGSAKLSVKWYEFDIGWCYIRLLSLLGLAKVRKVAPKPAMKACANTVDAETVIAVFTHRFHIMADFASQVTGPVLQAESGKLSTTSLADRINKVKAALIKNDQWVSAQEQAALQEALPHSQPLSAVYQARQQLQAIWDNANAKQEDVVHALQEWCQQAEQSRIEALQRFSENLRRYAVA